MPQLKQPTPLQNIATDVLVGFLANYCDQLSADNSLDRLREVVAIIKKDISPHIPGHLLAEFHNQFLQEFENLHDLRMNYRPIHRRAVLEVVMDRKITGLRCEGSIMAFFDPSDAHRFQGLRVLDLSCYCEPLPISLENFRLRDLTTCVFIKNCTDSDLEVIGQNCPKLVFLDVTDSKKVTDRGLPHLDSCSELRFVMIAFCRVSHRGITKFLSSHNKVEEIFAWANSGSKGFDCFSHSDSAVYPTIKSFGIVLNRISNDHLLSVVDKFPNLESVEIIGELAADLCLLKSLGKLSKLDFNCANNFSWDNLKNLLRLVGGNISNLSCASACNSCLVQSDLKFLYQFCGNIEHLKFHYRAISDGEKLVVPSFPKLEVLECSIPHVYRGLKAVLEFDRMLELRILLIEGFYVTIGSVKSMILDHTNFPKLKQLQISEFSSRRNGIDRISQFAKNNNLDLEIIEI